MVSSSAQTVVLYSRPRLEPLPVGRLAGPCGAEVAHHAWAHGASGRPPLSPAEQLSVPPPFALADRDTLSTGLFAFGPFLLCNADAGACSAMCYALSRLVRFRCMSDLLPARTEAERSSVTPNVMCR